MQFSNSGGVYRHVLFCLAAIATLGLFSAGMHSTAFGEPSNAYAHYFHELESDWLNVVAVAKGRARRPGAERLFRPGSDTAMQLAPDSPALLLIQQVRDEAHRFAITGHRQRRAKKRRQSPLEQIPGLGPKKRRELLRQFGGLQGVMGAGVDDLVKVRGIGRTLAETIYNELHVEH